MKQSPPGALQRLPLTMALIIVLVSPALLNAQDPRGTITGKVVDATQAVIQGATVEIYNVAMGWTVRSSSNDAGAYNAPYLIPGTYRITVEAPGFKKFVKQGVVLRVNDRLEVNVPLEVGGATETVTVNAGAAALETSSGSLGQVVDSRRVTELPVPHGEPYALIRLAGGAIFTGNPKLDRPFNPTFIVGYAINGTRANRNDLTIDGAPSTAAAEPNQVTASYVPPADIVQEFKVQTATFDASFGNTEGGVVNLSIKSGTNHLHGTGYWTKIVPALSANDFFANSNRVPPADFSYNRWGGSLGGPAYIPGLYDGRNKTFFMWGYEGIREASPSNNGNPTVPTEKMRNGDFSELLALGPQYQIYNPFTRRAVAGGRFQQDPFPGNIIPPNLINPIARKFVDTYLPKPLTTGNPDGTGNFQQPALLSLTEYYTMTIRVDHVISDRQRIFVRGSWYPNTTSNNNYYHNIATGEESNFFSRQGVIDDVYTFNATTVLNVRYGYNRFIRAANQNPGNHGFELTSLGFPSSYNSLIPKDIRRFPAFMIAGYQGTGSQGEFRPNDTHSFNAIVNKTMGEHFLKGGMEFRAYRENDFFFSTNQTGFFVFDSTWTRGPLDNSATAPGQLGQSFAAFLLGLPSPNSFINLPASYAEQSLTWGYFIHDDWKVSPKLTLNLGLRWEYESPLTERYNRSVSGFDFNAAQPIEAAAQAAYARNPTPEIPASDFRVRGGLLFASDRNRGLYGTPKKNLMPRFGFAFKLSERTVVRGGYGMFYGFLGERRGDVVQSGFSATTPMNVTLDNGLTFIETLSNPFQNGLVQPRGSADGIQTFLGQSLPAAPLTNPNPIGFFNQHPQTSYNQRWQLGFQHELPGGFVAQASYVGNRGTHIEILRDLNATPQRYLSHSPVRDNATNSYLAAALPNPFFGLMPASASSTFRATTIARERLLRPFPQFDSVTSTTYDGYSWYHSLQLGIEKRFSKGYTMLASYTFSKFMQATELLNQDDPRPVEVISDADRPHSFTVSGIFELPFGRRKPLLNNVNTVVSKVVTGWQVSAVYGIQSGAPLTWGNIIFNGDIREIVLPENQRTVGIGGRWFDTNHPGWVKAANQQLVRNLRTFPLRFGFIRGDKINNIDVALTKKTKIAEGKEIQFKAEFLNAFNHPFFPAPVLDPTNVAFGSVNPSLQANYPRRIQLTAKFSF